MFTMFFSSATAAGLLAAALSSQLPASDPPDFSGAWSSYRANTQAASAAAGQQFNAVAEAAIDDYQKVVGGTNYSPGNACVGSGMPSSMLGSGGYPMEIVQRPEQLFVIYEAHSEMRRLYIGDEAQNPEDFFRERNGYSVSHWEGDHLIVETSRLKTQVDSRYPHSREATIIEDYYLDEPLEDGTRILVAEMTMTDPLWLAEPFKTIKMWQQISDYHVLSYECSEPKWLDEMETLYETAGLEMVQD
jgi:hypothetical protein